MLILKYVLSCRTLKKSCSCFQILTCSSEAPSNLCGHTNSISVSFERQLQSEVIKSGIVEIHIYASGKKTFEPRCGNNCLRFLVFAIF